MGGGFARNDVNIEHFGQTLKEELGRNKAKSLALLAIFLIAIYMWAPRLIRLMRGNATETAAAEETENGDAEEGASTPRTAAGALTKRWDQLLNWRSNDPWMKTVALGHSRDPFRRSFAAAGSIAGADDENTNLIAEPPPPPGEAAAELVVTKTLIGRQRWATINGKQYKVNDRVLAAEDADADPIEFRLEEIHADRVLLSRFGRRYEVSLNKDWKAMRERVTVRRASANE